MTPPRPRRSGPSLTPQGADDISSLSLDQIRARLERNERVLHTSLLSTSPPVSSLTRVSSRGQTLTDPVREKLLVSRQELLRREQDLVEQDGERSEGMDVSEGGETSQMAKRQSQSGKVGKARILETIQAGEGGSTRNGVLLYVHSIIEELGLTLAFVQNLGGNVCSRRKGLRPRDFAVSRQHVTLPKTRVARPLEDPITSTTTITTTTTTSTSTTTRRPGYERRDCTCSSYGSNEVFHEL